MGEYWEKRYSRGGTSGAGSVGKTREWKWKVIDGVVGPLDSVVDVSCGDLSFWENRDCEKYVGIDISETVISLDRVRRPSWTFVCAPAENKQDVKGKTVFCMDVLFHIMDDDKYDRILSNLVSYSTHWIVVSTWYENPLATNRLRVIGALVGQGKLGPAVRFALSNSTTDFAYQKYRVFENYNQTFEQRGFKLVHTETQPPSQGLYIFSNKGEDVK
jgi:2-polyprenyl-3-methyl-5-hydroxy-6-metoxy-1,4-benzoquinol methylase